MTGESGHGSLTDQWRNLSFYTKGARLTGSKGRGGKSGDTASNWGEIIGLGPGARSRGGEMWEGNLNIL